MHACAPVAGTTLRVHAVDAVTVEVVAQVVGHNIVHALARLKGAPGDVRGEVAVLDPLEHRVVVGPLGVGRVREVYRINVKDPNDYLQIILADKIYTLRKG